MKLSVVTVIIREDSDGIEISLTTGGAGIGGHNSSQALQWATVLIQDAVREASNIIGETLNQTQGGG